MKEYCIFCVSTSHKTSFHHFKAAAILSRNISTFINVTKRKCNCDYHNFSLDEISWGSVTYPWQVLSLSFFIVYRGKYVITKPCHSGHTIVDIFSATIYLHTTWLVLFCLACNILLSILQKCNGTDTLCLFINVEQYYKRSIIK